MQNRSHFLRLLSLLWLLFLLVVFAKSEVNAAAARSGTVERVTFHATALEKNLAGDPADQPAVVYLPPSYAAEPQRRFPVIYLLHGLGMKAGDWERSGPGRPALSDAITAALQRGAFPETIVVYANGANAFMGSLYMNSALSGNWEDALVRDLVAWVDARYRTLPQAASRGITGLSMGGFGSLRFGFLHPDVFSVVYALSPAFIGFAAEFSEQNPTMASAPRAGSYAELQRIAATSGIRENYTGLVFICAAALSPNLDVPPLRVEFPFVNREGRAVRNDAVYTRWQAAMPLTMLDAQLANIKKLRGLGFDVGTHDHFRHIPVTVRALDKELTARGIAHQFEEFDGGHVDHAQERLVEHALPFIAKRLLVIPDSK